MSRLELHSSVQNIAEVDHHEKRAYESLPVPAILRGMVLVASNDPNLPQPEISSLGNFERFPNNEERDRYRRERIAYSSVKVAFQTQPSRDTRLVITLVIHYAQDDIYTGDRIQVVVDDTTIPPWNQPPVRPAPVIATAIHEMGPQERGNLEARWAIRLNEAPYAQLIQQQKLFLVQFRHNGNGKGVNFYTEAEHAEFTQPIRHLQAKFRSVTDIDLLVESPFIPETVATFNAGLLAVQARDPIRDFFPADKTAPLTHLHMNRGELLSVIDRPDFKLPAEITFKTWPHYLVAMGYACHGEHAHTNFSGKEFGPFPGRLIALNGYGDNRYLLILNFSNEDTDGYYPAPGDKVGITIEEHRRPGHHWHGVVAESGLPFVGLGQICLWITRPRDSENPREWVNFTPPIVPSLRLRDLNGSITQLVNRISEAPTTEVRIVPREDETNIKQRLATLNHISLSDRDTPRNPMREHAGLYRQLKLALLANNVSDLPKSNLFDSEFIPDRNERMNQLKLGMSEEQAPIVDLCAAAPGRFVIVEGPGGTGKTTSALKIVASIAIDEPVLACAPTNDGADELAKKAHRAIHDWATEHNLPGSYYIARIHSTDTERNILQRDATIARGPCHISPFDPDMQEDLSDLHFATMIMERHDQDLTPRIPGIFDKRVNIADDPAIELPNPEHAIHIFTGTFGWHMARKAGLLKWPGTDELLPGADPTAHIAFLDLLSQYTNGDEFTPEVNRVFTETFNALAVNTWKDIHFAASTAIGAAQSKVRRDFRPVALLADESAKSTEVELLLSEANYPSIRAFILVGDPRQLKPTVMSLQDNQFASQLHLSQHTRLRLAGFPSVQLRTQHRFCEELNDLISRLFYNGELNPSAEVNNHPMRQQMKDINQKLYGRSTNLIWLRVDSESNKSAGTSSTFNVIEVQSTIMSAKQYIDSGVPAEQIAIITPYQAQYVRMIRAYEALIAHYDAQRATQNSVDNIAEGEIQEEIPNYRGIYITKFDQITGKQREVVLISFARTDSPGFLAEANRLNAALSRARFCVTVIGNYNRMSLMRKVQRFKLGKVLNYFYDYVVPFIPETPRYLTDLFYKNTTGTIEELGDKETGWRYGDQNAGTQGTETGWGDNNWNAGVEGTDTVVGDAG